MQDWSKSGLIVDGAIFKKNTAVLRMAVTTEAECFQRQGAC